ncbi:hypothetical protein FJZ53_05325 [Candidatus Woesearchaeota archaeon]|nr:hypothetical protein [Candidatus Woesearchaeota archaeon]
MNNPKLSGIITLEDLKEDKRVYVMLDKDYLNDLVLNLKKHGSNIKEIANNSGIRYTLLNPLIGNRQEAIRLKDVWDICEFLEQNKFDCIPKLKTSITELKGQNGHGIKNPKLPINFNNKEGARIIASLYGDGGVCGNTNRPLYSNKQKVLIKTVLSCINNVIGKVYYSSQSTRGCTDVIFPPILGFIYEKVGYKAGNKIKTQNTIPPFVYHLQKDIILEFLSQLIDDEGTLYCKTRQVKHRGKKTRRLFYSIRLTFSNEHNLGKVPAFLESLLRLLHKIDIYPNYKISDFYITKHKEKREKWTIHLSGREFYNNTTLLNLISSSKKSRLKRILRLKKESHMSKQELHTKFLSAIKALEKKNEDINSSNLSKNLNLSLDRSRELLAESYKKKYLTKIIGQRIFNKNRFAGQLPTSYKPNNRMISLSKRFEHDNRTT